MLGRLWGGDTPFDNRPVLANGLGLESGGEWWCCSQGSLLLTSAQPWKKSIPFCSWPWSQAGLLLLRTGNQWSSPSSIGEMKESDRKWLVPKLACFNVIDIDLTGAFFKEKKKRTINIFLAALHYWYYPKMQEFWGSGTWTNTGPWLCLCPWALQERSGDLSCAPRDQREQKALVLSTLASSSLLLSSLLQAPPWLKWMRWWERQILFIPAPWSTFEAVHWQIRSSIFPSNKSLTCNPPKWHDKSSSSGKQPPWLEVFNFSDLQCWKTKWLSCHACNIASHGYSTYQAS